MRRVSLLAVSLVFGSCHADEDRCAAHWRDIEFTTQLADGTSAESLMAALGGVYTGTLTWQVVGTGSDEVVVDPMTGEAAIGLAFDYDGGEVLLLAHAEDRTPEERRTCPDRLRFVASLGVSTADGALEGVWELVVDHELGDGDRVQATVSEVAAGNEGDLSFEFVHPDWWDAGSEVLAIGVTVEDGGMVGDLALDVGPMTIPDMFDVTLATWSASR